MSRKCPTRTGNPYLRQQKHVPAPPIKEIEQEIFSLLSPRNFKPLKLYKNEEKKKFRDRMLTLPVMMAIVVSLVYRQIPGLREVQRVLSQEGLLWVERMEVSAQAVSKRLLALPIDSFCQKWMLPLSSPLVFPQGVRKEVKKSDRLSQTLYCLMLRIGQLKLILAQCNDANHLILLPLHYFRDSL